MISQYNREQPEGVHNLMHVVTKRLRIEGFVIRDTPEMEEQSRKDVTPWLLEGKIKYKETITHGIEKTPDALVDVLHGRNFGKQVVKIADM